MFFRNFDLPKALIVLLGFEDSRLYRSHFIFMMHEMIHINYNSNAISGHFGSQSGVDCSSENLSWP